MRSSKGRTRYLTVITTSLVVLGLGLSACGSSDTQSKTSPSSSSSSVKVGKADSAVEALVPADLRSEGSITFASSASHPPNAFFSKSNDLVGWEIELGKALAVKMGLTPEFKTVDFSSIIPGLSSGRFDAGLSGISDNKERQAVVTFVDYFTAGTSLVVEKGNPEDINSIEHLCGHRVAIEVGTSQVDFAKDQSEKCKSKGSQPIDISTFTSQTQVQLQIRTGRATAGLNDFPVAAYIAKQSNDTLEAVVGDKKFSAPYGIAMPKKSTELTKAMQAALKSVIDDGTYAKILAEWELEPGSLTTAAINGAGK